MQEKFLKYLYKRPLKIFFDKAVGKARAPKHGFARDFEANSLVILSAVEGSRSMAWEVIWLEELKKLNTMEIKTL